MHKNIENNKVVVSNKVSVGKKKIKYLIDYKDAKKLCVYAYFFQKWLQTEETLLKLNIFFVFIKSSWIIRKI